MRYATVVGPRSRIRSSGSTFSIAFSSAVASAAKTFAVTASMGTGTLPGNWSRIACASPTSSGSASDLPILPPSASTNVLAMPPPTISTSTFAASARRIVSLVDTFEPATIATSGPRRFGERLAQRVELGGEQRAGAGDRCEARNAVRRRLGAVRGAEGVVRVDVAELRHLLRELVAVLLLALVHAAVLEQHHLPGLQRRVPRAAVDPVADQRHRYAEQLGQALADRRERVLRLPLAFVRAAEMRRDHHRGAAPERVPDRGYGRPDARVVGDVAGVVLRHVQVGADEHALAADVEIGEALEFHRRRGGDYFAAISATVVSSIRLEKPHSLSYQLDTLTSRPDTLVSVESNVDDAGSWLKSTDTSGALL